MIMEIQSKLKLYLLVCLLILLIPSTHSQAQDFSYCTKMLYPVTVSGVHISPYPVRPGKPATFNISASTEEAISGGKLLIDVSYFGIHVHKEKRNLCKEVLCPVNASSNFVISHTQSLPKITPPGSYTLRMTLENKSKVQLTCIRFGFKVGFSSSTSEI